MATVRARAAFDRGDADEVVHRHAGVDADGCVAVAAHVKAGSECTFRMLARPADLCRAGAAPQLRFDGCTEAVRAQRVLPLQMQTDGGQVIVGDGLPDQLAVGHVAAGRVMSQREKRRMRVSHLGQPIGYDYGSFWQSPGVSVSKDLKAWKGQHVKLVFSVEQDGWGDQSQASITGLTIDSCAIGPLSNPPFSDSLAQSFENGQRIDTAHLTPDMQAAEACFTGLVGAWRLNSAYRPSEYQGHLREIWDKWKAPGNLQTNTSPACAATRTAVKAEFNKHGLGASHIRPASPNGTHTRGLAIDMSIGGLQNVDALAGQCHLYRPFPTRDKVHFLHK